MKTAKELFEDLGFKQEKNDEQYIVYKRCFMSIVFDKNEKVYDFRKSCGIEDCKYFLVGVELQEAINKQIKELG